MNEALRPVVVQAVDRVEVPGVPDLRRVASDAANAADQRIRRGGVDLPCSGHAIRSERRVETAPLPRCGDIVHTGRDWVPVGSIPLDRHEMRIARQVAPRVCVRHDLLQRLVLLRVGRAIKLGPAPSWVLVLKILSDLIEEPRLRVHSGGEELERAPAGSSSSATRLRSSRRSA